MKNKYVQIVENVQLLHIYHKILCVSNIDIFDSSYYLF